MEIDYRAIGDKLRSIREERNLTQEMVASQSGISIVHIGNIENARKKVGLEKLLSYCETLGVTIDYILGVTDAIVDDDTMMEFRYKIMNCDVNERQRLFRIINAFLDN